MFLDNLKVVQMKMKMKMKMRMKTQGTKLFGILGLKQKQRMKKSSTQLPTTQQPTFL
jgi:hypothetical protein